VSNWHGDLLYKALPHHSTSSVYRRREGKLAYCGGYSNVDRQLLYCVGLPSRYLGKIERKKQIWLSDPDYDNLARGFWQKVVHFLTSHAGTRPVKGNRDVTFCTRHFFSVGQKGKQEAFLLCAVSYCRPLMLPHSSPSLP
jgi:hypothetical protein